MTSKERSYLRSLAQNIEPIGQIGKGGISDNMLAGISDALEKREIVKISVLKNSEEEASGITDELARALNAEPVCSIGHKIILYRKSKKDGIKHIL